jgi:predicted MFS family arabinose efflux permease
MTGLTTKSPRIFYGWYIVAAAVLIQLYIGGVVNFGFTAVFDPLSEEFGWSSAQISLAASLRGLEVGLLSAAVGLLLDRWGPRKLLIAGTLLIFLGYLILSGVSSLGMFYAAFALIALGMSACTGIVLLTAVNHWFRRRAGLTTGIVASGFGLGGLIVPVVTGLIDTFEWRTAMLVIGIGMLVICLPLSLFVRHKPEAYGYLPDGDAAVEAPREAKTAGVQAADTEVNVPVWEALKDRAFWHISLSSMCHSFVVGAVVTHIMPYLGSVGISRSTAALVALVLPVASIAGRLSSGWLSNIMGNRAVYAGSFVSFTVGMFLFAYTGEARLWLIVPFVVAFSSGWGFSVTSRITLLRESFGRASFGAVLGFNSTIMMIGNVSGAPIAGWTYDRFGSYQGAWLVFGAITLVGMMLAFTTPTKRR